MSPVDITDHSEPVVKYAQVLLTACGLDSTTSIMSTNNNVTYLVIDNKTLKLESIIVTQDV